MNYRKMNQKAQARQITSTKVLIAFLTVVAMWFMMAMPVLASDAVATSHNQNNIIVYDKKEKILKITEISFSSDYSAMSVLVENMQTKASFRIEHDLNTGDTFNESIEVTATDGVGNYSETVYVKNPFYEPLVTETLVEEEPIKGGLTVNGSSNSADNNDITKPKEDKAEPQNNPSNGFNTDGWTTVVDNATANNKEFFIVRSETGNEFYIIIDRENGKDNVYFLNAVTEWDLLGLTKQYEVPNNLDPNSGLNNLGNVSNAGNNGNSGADENNQEQIKDEENQAITPQELPKKSSSGTFGIIIIVLFGAGVAAYFYFFKFKKKEVVPKNNDGYLEDNYGYDEEEDEEETGDSSEKEQGKEDEEKTGDSSEKEEDDNDFGEKSEQEVFLDKPKIEAEKFDKNAASESKVVEDEVAFTDEDIGENDIGDDYGEEINAEEVLGVGVIGGEFDDDNEEDNTV